MYLVVFFELLQVIEIVPPAVQELIVNADEPGRDQFVFSSLIFGKETNGQSNLDRAIRPD